MIFVANGSGDASNLSDNLWEVITNCGLPFRVSVTRWTTYGGAAQDHNDVINHRKWGQAMAYKVMAFKQSCPHVRVYLMGHSSGTHVVLAAAECLPPGSVDRIVLLAPSVSCTYDLRQAIRASQEGIDVYYSLQDGVLDAAVDRYGTADALRGIPAAGQVGFRRPPITVPDAQLYCMVRQHPWTPGLYDGTGNQGGHVGPVKYAFLRLVVLPNMTNLPR
jgi:hypothetical protein